MKHGSGMRPLSTAFINIAELNDKTIAARFVFCNGEGRATAFDPHSAAHQAANILRKYADSLMTPIEGTIEVVEAADPVGETPSEVTQ